MTSMGERQNAAAWTALCGFEDALHYLNTSFHSFEGAINRELHEFNLGLFLLLWPLLISFFSERWQTGPRNVKGNSRVNPENSLALTAVCGSSSDSAPGN